jgi:hypothetical protein
MRKPAAEAVWLFGVSRQQHGLTYKRGKYMYAQRTSTASSSVCSICIPGLVPAALRCQASQLPAPGVHLALLQGQLAAPQHQAPAALGLAPAGQAAHLTAPLVLSVLLLA